MTVLVPDQANAVPDHANTRARTRPLPWIVNARRGGIVIAGLLALTGLVFVWQASLLDLGKIGLPGPGFFPLALGALLVVCSIVIGVGCWRASPEGEPAELGHPHVLIAFAALLMVPVLFDTLGAYLTLGLFTAALLVFVARLSLLLTAVWTVLGMAACWLVFEVLLGLTFPSGPF
jgi:tripartite tricarboxylate transporter TctB family protein